MTVEELAKEVEALKKRMKELEELVKQTRRESGIIDLPPEPEHKYVEHKLGGGR